MIIFRRPGEKIPLNLKIAINGQQLYPTNSIKYLGIHIDEHLRGITHVEGLLPKLRRANGIL